MITGLSDDAAEILAQRMTSRMEETGLSFTQLSERTGIIRSRLCAFSNNRGKYHMSADDLVRIATALGVSTDWLVGMPVEDWDRPIDCYVIRWSKTHTFVPGAVEAAAWLETLCEKHRVTVEQTTELLSSLVEQGLVDLEVDDFRWK